MDCPAGFDTGPEIRDFWNMREARAPQFPAAPAGELHLSPPGAPGW